MAVAGLVALAGGLFAAAWSSRPTPSLVARGRAGPLSTLGRPAFRSLPSVDRPVPATDLRVRTSFVVRRHVSPADLFALGPPKAGLQVRVGRVARGVRRVYLLASLQDGSPVNELVGIVRPGRPGHLSLSLSGGKELVVVLDGHRVLTNYPFVEFAPDLSHLAVGSGPGGHLRFTGRVDHFTMSYRQLSQPVAGGGYRALEAGAGIALVLAALVALIGAGAVLDDLGVPPAGSPGAQPAAAQGAAPPAAAPPAAAPPAAARPGLSAGELEVASRWLVLIAVFAVALCVWWVAYEYFRDPSAAYGLGFWQPSDRAGWLPVTAPYYPLVGQHFFGDFFQFFYLIRTHTVYAGHRFHTDLNPGYLLPSALVSWLPYPAAGFCYVTGLLAAWALPGFVIGRARPLLGACYLIGATLTVPGLMALDLGQPQVFVYVLGLGALALFRTAPRASWVLMGLAIAMKPYMALFLLLYVFRRRARDAGFALGLAVVLNLVLGAVLGGAHFFSAHVLGQIVGGMTSYGSGGSLKIWGGEPFLHDNASLFALFETLHQAGAPVVGAVGGALAAHYWAVQAVVGLGLAWLLLARRNEMAIEDQWLVVTAAILLIPSYSLGYAWLLLLVPLALRTWRVASSPDLRPDAGGATAYLPLLAVAAYPTVIAGAAFANPAFGPNGNAIATPLLVSALVLAIAWRAPRWRLRPVAAGMADRAFLFAVAGGLGLELVVAAITFGLSGAVRSR